MGRHGLCHASGSLLQLYLQDTHSGAHTCSSNAFTNTNVYSSPRGNIRILPRLTCADLQDVMCSKSMRHGLCHASGSLLQLYLQDTHNAANTIPDTISDSSSDTTYWHTRL